MRGSIQQRGTTSWRVKAYVGRDGTGRKLYVSRTVHGSRRDAERELSRLLVEADEGRFVASPAMTLNEMLDRWLAVKRPAVGEPPEGVEHRCRSKNPASDLHLEQHWRCGDRTRRFSEGHVVHHAGPAAPLCRFHRHERTADRAPGPTPAQPSAGGPPMAPPCRTGQHRPEGLSLRRRLLAASRTLPDHGVRSGHG